MHLKFPCIIQFDHVNERRLTASRLLLFIFLSNPFFISTQVKAESIHYFISKQGNDNWDGKSNKHLKGTKHGPFATLKKAQNVVRQIKSSKGNIEKVTVNILQGKYTISKPLIFNTLDSGTLKSPIIYRSYNNENVILTGAKEIHNCINNKSNIVTCNFNLTRTDHYISNNRFKGSPPPFDLYVSNQRMVLARWPNKINSHDLYKQWAYTDTPVNNSKNNVINYFGERPKKWKDASNIQVHIWPNDWFDQYLEINKIEPETNSIYLESPVSYKISGGRRFYVRNLLEELDAPTEWFFDKKAKKIHFIPPENNLPNIVEASSTDHIIQINGADNIRFHNLTFEKTRKTSVIIRNSNNILFSKCNIHSTGRHAINISGGNNNKVIKSVIYNTGLGGIVVKGGDRNKLAPSNHTIKNNEIFNTGNILRTNQQPIIVHGVGNIISNNLIHDVPHAGIRIFGNNNIIEKNELHNTCKYSSDCGAIYIGRDWTFHGNIIRHNIIRDINGYGLDEFDSGNSTISYSSPNGARGIYIDDGASGISAIGNIIYRVGHILIQIGGGRNNTVENNILIGGNNPIRIDARWDGFPWEKYHKKRLNDVPIHSDIWKEQFPELSIPMKNYRWPEGNTIRLNIISATEESSGTWSHLRFIIPKNNVTIDRNLIWNNNKQVFVEKMFLGKDKKLSRIVWEKWIESGLDSNSIIKDPLFTNASHDNYSLNDSSPAFKIGFQAIPVNSIGLQTNNKSKDIPSDILENILYEHSSKQTFTFKLTEPYWQH